MQASTRVEKGTGFKHVNGVRLYYEERGHGQPILLIHGTSSSALVWEGAAALYAERGRAISYDRRGSHRSERPQPYEADVADHVTDAIRLLDALDATPAILIGRSYGGGIALSMAHRFPAKIEALVLLEPAIISLHRDLAAWAQPVINRVLSLAEQDISSVAEVFIQEVAGDEAWESFPAEIQQMLIGNGPAIVAELKGPDLDLRPEELAQIEHPTLLVSAMDSPAAFRHADAFLAEALPNSETATVEGGHLIDPAHPTIVGFVDRLVGLKSTGGLKR